MFRIEQPIIKPHTVRFPIQLKRQLQDVAKDYGISLNRLVIQCCKYALAHRAYPDPEQKEKPASAG